MSASDTLEVFGVEYTGVAGIKATDDNGDTKTYIRPVGTKSITQNGTGIDVTEFATVNVNVSGGGGSATLGTKTITQNGTYNASSDGYDGYSQVTSNVPTGTARTSSDLTVSGATVTAPAGLYATAASKTVASGSATAPASISGTAATVSTGTNTLTLTKTVSVTPSVTAGYISSGTAGNSSVSLTANVTTKAAATITPSTSQQTIAAGTYLTGTQTISAMPSGTAGTPTATKGTVSNHSVSVTPSVTNSTGYITGSTKTGTAVTVTAAELASGNKEITQNGTNIDVVGYSTVSVSVSGGGGASLVIATEGTAPSSASSSISFTGLSGEPTSFVVIAQTDLATGASPYKVAAVVFDGTNLHGQTITNTSNAQVTYDGSSFSKSYSNGTLTITSTGAYFQNVQYQIIYSYGGGVVDTKDVQVGSGATSITFTGLEGEPDYWSCIFKSNFSTSSGYQRVIVTEEVSGDIDGLEMDSGANYSYQHWTSSYSNGSLTITSSGTNAGGYFHQPGYYQLTYAYDDGSSGNYQTKSVTYTPSTSQQTDSISADSGYDALKKVNVTVNAMPTMTLPTAASSTSSGTSKATITPTTSAQYLNIPTGYNSTAQYYTIAATSGGGTSSKNVQAYLGYASRTANSYGATSVTLTVAKTGTYKICWMAWRGSSSGTMGTNLHIGNTTGTNQQTWTGTYGQCITLNNQSLTENQVLTLYATSGSNSRTIYVGNLIIEEQ